MEEAKAIVEEMGHAFTMKNIRMLGYLFPKVYRRLYDHIYINREGIDKVCMVNCFQMFIIYTTYVYSAGEGGNYIYISLMGIFVCLVVKTSISRPVGCSLNPSFHSQCVSVV